MILSARAYWRPARKHANAETRSQLDVGNRSSRLAFRRRRESEVCLGQFVGNDRLVFNLKETTFEST